MKSMNPTFIFGDEYNRVVKSLLSHEGDIDMAVAFVGSGANDWLRKKKSKYRLIVNLSSGGTNPKEIKILRKRKNCNVRQLNSLHAKVFISDTAAIIGSANLSINGLGLEYGEYGNWEEAGIITSTSDNKRTWFNALWKKATKINDYDLKKAEEMWNTRQKNRPAVQNKNSLSILKNRGIDLLLAWDKIDKKEKKDADEKFKKKESNKGLEPDKHVYAYAGYDFDYNSVYYSYWIRKKGKGDLVFEGIELPMSPKRKYGDIEYLLRNNEKIHHGILLKQYQTKITRLLREYLNTKRILTRDGGKIIKLDDVLK